MITTVMRTSIGGVLLFVSLLNSASAIAPSSSVQPQSTSHQPVLRVDWAGAKAAFRDPDCCVVSITGLESHLKILQDKWSKEPSDIDLRARIRVRSSAYEDCLQVRQSVSPLNEEAEDEDPCAAALKELARGVASMADGPLEGKCEDVFIRIVCASDYRALDPMFHTDKAPLRGYVTLCGVGTEFMTRPSTPMEYVALRSLGAGTEPSQCVREAQELEFIIMKGDHYQAPPTDTTTTTWLGKVWKRTSACVHRSPPGAARGGRRVIVSFDLADGDDDREWYDANKKREWRAGMTQRKSRLVA